MREAVRAQRLLGNVLCVFLNKTLFNTTSLGTRLCAVGHWCSDFFFGRVAAIAGVSAIVRIAMIARIAAIARLAEIAIAKSHPYCKLKFIIC